MERKSQQKKQIQQAKQLSKRPQDNTYSLDAYRAQKTKNYVNPYEKKSLHGTAQGNRAYTNTYTQPNKKANTYSNPYSSTYTPYTTGTKRNSSENAGTQASSQNTLSSKKLIKEPRKLSRQEAVTLKKKHKRRYRMRIMLTVILVIISVYSGVKLLDFFTYPSVSYETVKVGIIDNSTKSEGIILRDESVYASPLDGNVHYLTNEGEKVKKDGEVCYIANDVAMTTELEKVEAIDDSIYNIQDKRQNLSSYQTEVNTLNQAISGEMSAFYKERNITNTQSIYLLRNQLDRAIQTRTSLYVNETTDRIDHLQTDRVAAMNDLNGSHEAILSDKAGIVSYQIDGFENSLEIGQLETLTQANYKEIMNKDRNDSNSKSIVQSVKGEPLYKLIRDEKWYIVTYVAIEDGAKYELGKNYDLYFENLIVEKLGFKLTLKQEEEKKVKLVFETREQINAFLPYRTIDFTIGKQKAEGLKIPLTAIVEKNLLEVPENFVITQSNGQGVLRTIGETTEFVPVNVQYTEEGKTYILQELDKLTALTIGQTIQDPVSKATYMMGEMRTIQGVYAINGRYAKFKKVVIDMKNSESAIVNEEASGLKAMDQIISNPKSIKEDQLLKYMNIQNE